MLNDCVRRNPRAIFFTTRTHPVASRNPHPLKLNLKEVSTGSLETLYVHYVKHYGIFFFFFPSLCSIERDCGKFCSSGVSHVALVYDSRTMEEKGKVMIYVWFMLFTYVCIKSSCEIF